MRDPSCRAGVIGCVLFALLLAAPALGQSQIEDQLSAYTGANAEGYLTPLAEAFGADLNSGLYHSAAIATEGFSVSIEIQMMAVLFVDEDKTFTATTEGGFTPEQTATAPTAVGSGEVVVVDGDAGSAFAFPGGLDLSSFALAAPQARIGIQGGTEALLRWVPAYDIEDVGEIGLLGIGVRHNVSQYFVGLPVEVAAGVFWQSFSLGEDFIDATAMSYGIQASKNFGLIEPYAGLAMDTFSMDVTYDTEVEGETEAVDLSFDTDSAFHITLGANLNLGFLTANAEYNIANQNGFAAGIGFGF
jgi:hypothetical protein